METTTNLNLPSRLIDQACSIVGLLVIAAAFGLLAYSSILLTLETGRVAAFWIGNALMIGFLLGRGKGYQVAALAVCFVANMLANFAIGDPVGVAMGIASANAMEMALSIFALERFVVRSETFQTLREFTKMVAVGALAPILPALLVATLLASTGAGTFAFNLVQWLTAHCLPIPIFASLVLIVRNALHNQEDLKRTSAKQWGAVFGLVAIAVPLIFAQSTYPFLFLAAPVVVFAAFKTGRLGTAIVVAIFACAASAATLLDSGPIALVRGGARDEVIALQAFLASCLAIGLPVAVILANRNKIRSDLQDSRDFVNSILNGIGDLVFRVDAEWRFTYLNPRWEQVTGFPSDELLGETPFTRLLDHHTLDLKKEKAAIEAGHGSDERHVVQTNTADGKTLQIAIGLTAQFDEYGTFTGAIGTGTDVTESIARTHALTESEARFRKLAEASPVGIFQADATGQITYVNSIWLEKFGLDDKAMLGDGWKTALASGEEYEDDPAFTGFNMPGDVRRRTIRFRDADDEDFWVETVNAAEFDEFGNISGFVGALHDITDRKKALDQLAEREEQLTLLANNATDAVLRLSLDGACLYASPSSKQIFKFDPGPLTGGELLAWLHEEDRAKVRRAFGKLAAGEEEKIRVAFRSAHPADRATFQWLEANCGIVRDPKTGEPTEIIASLRNIDETKQLEAALLDAKENAEHAAEAKSAFLANMSHEIRTPMNGVIGFTELALSGELEDDQRQNLEMIAESGRAMLRLLNDLLDFAKIESGQMTLSSEPTDIRHKLRGALRILEPVAVQKGLTLKMDVDNHVPDWISSDPMRLRQIMLNLLGNALKFTERGTVCVTVSYDRAQSELTVEVADTGIGIASDQIDAVFEKFTQADSSIARRFGGTGLGLPICSQLASLLGGTLRAESEVGCGSTFILTLPVSECDAPREADIASAQSAERSGAASSLRVLVAEDNYINQQLTLAMLEKAGCIASLAEDGAEAVAMIAERHGTSEAFDIVLMDMQMPNLDGLQATRKVRSAGLDSETLPIIALTANAYQDDVDACLDAGMQAHLTKPMRLRQLEATLQAYAGKGVEEGPPDISGNGAADAPDSRLSVLFSQRKERALELIDRLLAQGELEGASLEDLAAELHQIAGVAAFFGEAELGEESRQLERDLLGGAGDKMELIASARARDLLAA